MSEAVVNGPRAGRPDGRLIQPKPKAGSLALHSCGVFALTLLLVSSGAFDSDDLPLGRSGIMFAVVSTLLIVQSSVLSAVALPARRPSLAGLAAGGAVATIATLLLMTLELHLLKATPIVPYEPDPIVEFALFLAPFVLPVSGFVFGLRWLLHAPASATPDFRPAPAIASRPAVAGFPPPPASFIDDWPAVPVWRVQALDHYLHLWTPSGAVFLRGRMRDALRRLSRVSGIQPHRSWWVARSQIDRVERRGRDHSLLLKSGESLPVARSRAETVKRLLAGD